MYLYKIIVRKSITLLDAIDIARPFLSTNMKQVFYSESKHHYTFINIKRKHFLSNDFDIRTNGKTTIYLGELKHPQFKKQHNMRGYGLLSYIYSGNWINDYSSKAKKVLQEHGNETIHSLTVRRTPIQDVIDKSLNIFSVGRWNKLKAKYGFDTFFHLALVAKTTKGNTIMIEKNEIINIISVANAVANPLTKTMDVDMKNKQLNINEMLENTREVLKNRKYFAYDAFDNNCQMYIKSILEENQLYSQAINSFLYQDISKLKQEIPSFLRQVANVALTVHSGISDAVA